ncbi:hypothetical protein C0991_002673, partial [Blastosporella zonata]
DRILLHPRLLHPRPLLLPCSLAFILSANPLSRRMTNPAMEVIPILLPLQLNKRLHAYAFCPITVNLFQWRKPTTKTKKPMSKNWPLVFKMETKTVMDI